MGEALAQTIKCTPPLPSRTLSAVQDGTRRELYVDLPEIFTSLIDLRVKSRRWIDHVLATVYGCTWSGSGRSVTGCVADKKESLHAPPLCPPG